MLSLLGRVCRPDRLIKYAVDPGTKPGVTAKGA